MVVERTSWIMQQKLAETEIEFEEDSFDEISDLPKLVFFGDEIIELDESMLSVLCSECKQLGYCKKVREKSNL